MEESIPKILVGFGAVLQFMRAQQKINDWWYGGSSIFGAVAVWMLVFGLPGTRESAVKLLAWLADPSTMPLIWGGTFGMSKVATFLAGTGNDALKAIAPVTDSKK